jgi:hypothetical protein
MWLPLSLVLLFILSFGVRWRRQFPWRQKLYCNNVDGSSGEPHGFVHTWFPWFWQSCALTNTNSNTNQTSLGVTGENKKGVGSWKEHGKGERVWRGVKGKGHVAAKADVAIAWCSDGSGDSAIISHTERREQWTNLVIGGVGPFGVASFSTTLCLSTSPALNTWDSSELKCLGVGR